MSSYTFTSDDLSLGLDPAYTPILQQNQTTNEERTLRWLDESTMLAFSENNSYFSMTAAVLGEFMAPQMVPSNSTSTISTTGTSSTDFPSIDDNYSIEKQQYQGPDAATPATMYTAEYEFMNDQSLFPPLYDNNNLNNITNDNSDIAAADTIIIPQVLSVSYSQDIVSPTSQFLDENNPSPHQGMNIQALPGPGENCQKQFAYPISMAPIYQGFSSADQGIIPTNKNGNLLNKTMWYQEQGEQKEASIVHSTFPIYHVTRQERQAVNSQKSILTSSNIKSYEHWLLCMTNNEERKKSELLHQHLAPQEAFQNHSFGPDHSVDTDAKHNSVAAIEVLQGISNNDNTSNISNSVAFRRQSRQKYEQQQRRRRRHHYGRTDSHFFRSYNRPQPSVVLASSVTSCSKTNNTCDICNSTFSRSRDVDRHKRSAHNASHRPYICSLCGKDFTRNDSLLRHRKTFRHLNQ